MGNYITQIGFNNYLTDDKKRIVYKLCEEYGMECIHSHNGIRVCSTSWIPSQTHVNKHKAFCFDLWQNRIDIYEVDISYQPFFII